MRPFDLIYNTLHFYTHAYERAEYKRYDPSNQQPTAPFAMSAPDTHIEISVFFFVGNLNGEDFTIQVPISATLGDVRAAIQERIGGRNLDRVWTTLGPQNTLVLFDATHRENDNLPVHNAQGDGTQLSVSVFRHSTPTDVSPPAWWADANIVSACSRCPPSWSRRACFSRLLWRA